MNGPTASAPDAARAAAPRGLRWAGTRAFLLECPSLADVVALHARLTAEPLPGQTEALAAADELAEKGVSAEVINIHTIKPLDEELVRASAAKTGHVVTAEEHSVIGGLGDAVLAALAESPVPLRKLGVNDVFGESGPAVDLLHKYNLDAAGIVAAVEGLLAK